MGKHTNPGRISVLMPAYNHEKYVETAVRSVLSQEGFEIELIVIDDGSKDATWSILQSLKADCEKRCVRVVMETQPNQGTCTTINRLLSLAQGEYIGLIASDDKYLPGALPALLAELESDPGLGLVVGQNEFMDGEGRRCFWDEHQNVVYSDKGAVYPTFNAYLEKKCGVGASSPNFGTYRALLRANHIPNGYLVRRSAFDLALPFTKAAPLEDHWLMLQIAKRWRMKMIDVPTFSYRWHAANTAKQSKRMLELAERTYREESQRVFASGDRSLVAAWEMAFAEDLRKDIHFGLGEFRVYGSFFARFSVLTLFGKRRIVSWTPR